MKFKDLFKKKKIKRKIFWKKLLLELYNSKADWTFYARGNKHHHISQDHHLCKILNCSARELESSLDFLKAHKLIEEDKNLYYQFNLTDKGFEVAMQIEKDFISRRNEMTNLKFVASLVMIAAIEVVLRLFELTEKKILSTSLYLVYLIIIGFFFSKLFLSLEK